MGMGLLNEGNALHGWLQSFAWADAMLCVRVELNGHRKVCPILDKIKGGKTHPTGHLAPRKFLLNPYIRNVLNIHCLCALCAFARAFSRRCLLRDIFLAKPPRSQKSIFPRETFAHYAQPSYKPLVTETIKYGLIKIKKTLLFSMFFLHLYVKKIIFCNFALRK
ncbi:hypothetical protein CIL02_13695 [Prevotella sp. P3-122]|nr:hypothetical protein CIL02_13695 [Prevotella sp. P3-122]